MGHEPVAVLDTHVLIWWLTSPVKLSQAAREVIQEAADTGGLAASAISVLEIVTAVGKGRLEFSMPVDRWLEDVFTLPELRFEPVSAEIAALAGSFGEGMHGDPADRLIVATAISRGAPLVTADTKIRDSGLVQTVW